MRTAYLLLTEFEVLAVSYEPNFSRSKGAFLKSEQKKKPRLRNLYTDQGNEFSKTYIIYFGSNREGRCQFKQTFKFSRPHREIQHVKLTSPCASI